MLNLLRLLSFNHSFLSISTLFRTCFFSVKITLILSYFSLYTLYNLIEMANENDLALNEQQSQVVAHMQEIVGCSTDEAVAHLIQAEWNLETAVNRFFNPSVPVRPELPPTVQDATNESPDESNLRQRSTAGSQGTAPIGPTYASVAARSNTVAQPQASGLGAWISSFTEIVLLPIRFTMSIISSLLRLLSK